MTPDTQIRGKIGQLMRDKATKRNEPTNRPEWADCNEIDQAASNSIYTNPMASNETKNFARKDRQNANFTREKSREKR